MVGPIHTVINMGIMDTLKKYSTPILYAGIVLVAVAVIVKLKVVEWIQNQFKEPY